MPSERNNGTLRLLGIAAGAQAIAILAALAITSGVMILERWLS